MTDTKHPLASKGMWGSVLAALASIVGLLGYTIAPERIETASVIAAQIGGLIFAILAAYGRLKAEKVIG